MRYQRKTRPAPWTLCWRPAAPERRVARVRPVSVRRGEQLRLYAKAKRELLDRFPTCECCARRKASDVHHIRGRAGRLLNERRWWMLVCRRCHDWIHGHVAEARERGWLCERGKWNSPT